MDVSHCRLQTWLRTKKHTSAVRMPRGNPHQKFLVVQMLYNAAADKTRAAKHGHNSILMRIRHGIIPNRTGATEASSIDLAEYDVERPEDRGNIGQHVALRQEVHGREMGE